MLELLAFLAANGPAVYDNNTKEYDILNNIDNYEDYNVIEDYLSQIGYTLFYEASSDCWVVMENYE